MPARRSNSTRLFFIGHVLGALLRPSRLSILLPLPSRSILALADGDKLDLSLTPSSLEMEDDDMVDVTVAKGATPAAQVKLRTRVNGDDKTFKEWKISSRDPLQVRASVRASEAGAK